jgi:hypothetical protein
MADTRVVIRRIHGRLVPIKIKRQGPDFGNLDAIKTGLAAGTASAGIAAAAVKARQYVAFKQAGRLADVAKRYAAIPRPTMAVSQVVSKGRRGFKTLAPDMFQKAQFAKKSQVWKAMQGKAVKFGQMAGEKLALSRTFKKWALPVAIGAGAVAGIGAYLGHIAIDHTGSKDRRLK